MSSTITHEPEGVNGRSVGAAADGAVPTPTIARPPAPSGWRHGAAWTYGVMLAASAVALLVSFILSAETLQLARHPRSSLSCDINAVLSCSAVAGSWQSEIVKLGTLSVPNAFLGIAAESVLITLAVIGMIRVSVPKWFTACTWFGGLAALAYAYWLFSQSVFVIQALCPWCLVLMFSTTVQFMALSHATVTVRRVPGHDRHPVASRRLDTYYRLHYDLMVDVVVVLALAAIILVRDGAAIF